MSISPDQIVSLQFFGYFTEIEKRNMLIHMLATGEGCLIHSRINSNCKDCPVAYESRKDRLEDCQNMLEEMHEEFVAFFERCLEL